MRTISRTLALSLAFLLIAGGCSKENDAGSAKAGAGAAKAKDKDRPTPVTAMTVGSAEWTDRLSALGTVVSNESVTVAAKVSETVQKVHFASGQFVRKGAPLVTLTGQQQDASLAQAQAQLREATSLYDRYAALAKDKYISQAQLDTQRTALDVARAAVRTVQANLSDRVIRAPFSGVLGLRKISPGALITPGTEIATLDDISSVFVDFPIPEVQLPTVRNGQSVSASSRAYGDKSFAGTVTNLATRVDPASRAVTVRARFANPGMELRPGMLLSVNVAQTNRPALSIPEIAVTQNGADSSVFRIGKDSKVSSVNVQLGDRHDGWVEVKSGILAGDRIVIDGVGKLTEGGSVKAAPYSPAPAAATGAPAEAPAP